MEPFEAFDADNHYYEPRDCFTSYIDPSFADVAIRPVLTADGDEVMVMGDQVLRFPVTKFDGVELPGAFHAVLSGEEDMSKVASERFLEFPRDAYRERGARLALMDEQHIDEMLILPTLGVTWEHEARHNLQALYANLRAFNRYVEVEWGFGQAGRIYGVPLVSLYDVDAAVAETRRVLDAGAKLVHLRPGPVSGRSIADPVFDPFWSIVNEACVPVAFHISDSGYNELFSAQWSEDPLPNVRAMSALQLAMFHCDRPIMDTLAACIMHNLFGRFPNVTVLSLEHGMAWAEYLLHALDHGAKMRRHGTWLGGPIEGLPSELFRTFIKVAPFPEENVLELVGLLGAENVLFGSDYPHPEGVVEPWDFAKSLESLDDRSIRMIMHDNIAGLISRAA